MSYYDNVKENIRSGNTQEKDGEDGKVSGNFDSLREAAEQTSDEEKGDDTPIEVLEEDGIRTESPKKQQQRNEQKEDKKENTNPLKQRSDTVNDEASESSVQADLSGIEEKMDRMIEQNDELIRILRSFTE